LVIKTTLDPDLEQDLNLDSLELLDHPDSMNSDPQHCSKVMNNLNCLENNIRKSQGRMQINLKIDSAGRT
jgi:hypothetical protein